MNMSLISKYRGQLMGFAILIVALFHSSIVHTNDLVDFFCFSGDMGVDIFFFLSGFGMYYACLKKPTYGQFMKKRMERIVPAWFLVNLYGQLDAVGFDLTKLNAWGTIKCMTGLSFLLNGTLLFWYIPAQLLFYAMTPLFMRIYEKSRFKAYLTYGVVWIGLLGLSILFHNGDYFIFLFRWPVYFMGIAFGELSYRKVDIGKNYLFMVGIIGVFGMVFVNLVRKYNYLSFVRYDYKYFVYVLVSIPLCLLLSLFFEKSRHDFKGLSFIGMLTLEIYLLHEMILRKVGSVIDIFSVDPWGVTINLLVFLGTVIVAWILHRVLSLLIKS